MFCNRRHIASSAVHKLVNKIYQPFMREASRAAAAEPMRENTFFKTRDTSECTLYPSFVLSITCPPDECDVLLENGKASVEFLGDASLARQHAWILMAPPTCRLEYSFGDGAPICSGIPQSDRVTCSVQCPRVEAHGMSAQVQSTTVH